MPQQPASLEFNTFVQGLITEASPLNFPDNASLAEDNMVLNRDGSRQRRLGIDFEPGYVFNPVTSGDYLNSTFSSTNTAVSCYRWDNVANDPTLSFGVVQLGTKLYFFDLYASSPSAALKNTGGTTDILPDLGVASRSAKCQFTAIGGKLVIACNYEAFLVLEYDKDTDTISSEFQRIEVRDFWGVDDGLDIDERPTSLTNEHKYNLYNQGWPDRNYRDINNLSRLPHNSFKANRGNYPSNADIFYLGLKLDGLLVEFSPNLVADFEWQGTTPAPKGNRIIDVFRRSTSRGITSGLDTTTGGINAVATYAGRLFLSGISVTSVQGTMSTRPRLESMIFFSQLASSDNKLNECYQEADPTQQDSVGLVATDGGYITIPEASRIYRLIPTGRSLAVIAENGVWEIYGSDTGFSATNYQVVKISNVGAVNTQSVIEAEGQILYWSKAGIYALAPNQVSGELTAQNLTETTIQTLYTEIPSVGKLFALGTYDEVARKVRWLYNDQDTYNGVSFPDRFNRELVLDLTLGAFYTNTIPCDTSAAVVSGFVSTPNYLSVTEVTDVVVGSDDVVSNSGVDDVVVETDVRTRGVGTTKYLTVRPGATYIEFSLSEYRNSDFLDWYTQDSTGTDAAAFMETGHFTGGDSTRDKWIKYLTVHCKRTEQGYVLDGSGNIVFDNPSSCLVQGRWDFSDSANSGKWSDQFQAYRFNRPYIPAGVGDPFDYGYDVITTKNKVRGNGRALRVRFETEAGKDLYLYGWGITMSQDGNV
jgi:hypothetical protein